MKENKIKNNQTLIYDLAVLPKGKTIGQIISKYNDTGIILWSSDSAMNMGGRNSEHEPKLIQDIKNAFLT